MDQTTEETLMAQPDVCPICWSPLVHQEYEGMMGWLCSDPDCGYFMPDPL